jgi:hypothetical protein
MDSQRLKTDETARARSLRSSFGIGQQYGQRIAIGVKLRFGITHN